MANVPLKLTLTAYPLSNSSTQPLIQMAYNFCNLSQELQIQILSILDVISLIRCAVTCKSIYDTLQNSSLLVYLIQLHLDGLKDAGTSIAYPDLIGSLVGRRQLWLSFKWTEPLIRHTQLDCRTYELVGGAFANTSKDCLQIIWLPTSNGVKGRTLRRPLNGISVRNFTMDLTQDLIIFLEDLEAPQSTIDPPIMRIHIRSISTHAIHPQAQQSPLQWTSVPYHIHRNTIGGVVLQVACNIVALYFHYTWGETRLLIWDWMTSDLILDTSVSFDPSLRFLEYDFGFLDSTYCFVTCRSISGSIRLYELVRSHAVTSPAIHLATLHLPPTSPGTTITRIFNQAGPIEANPLPHALFMINNDDRLHVFTLIYRHRVADSKLWHVVIYPFNLFLHQRVLSKYVHRAHVENLPLDVPWAEWGPQNTMFTAPHHTQHELHYLRYVHGQRAVFPGGIFGDYSCISDPSHYAEVLDFSRAAVLSAKDILYMSPPTPTGKPRRVLSSRIVRVEDVPFFLDDVETYLPCVISMIDLKRAHEAYLIHADGILGVNIKNEHKLFMYTV